MAVFYGKEKSKVGTNTGTIIHWARQLPTNDPEDQTRNYFPLDICVVMVQFILQKFFQNLLLS